MLELMVPLFYTEPGTSTAICSILIVEDIEAMRKLIRLVLEEAPRSGEYPPVRVSGAVGSTFEARLELDRRRPDLVLLDAVLKTESGLDLLPDLKSRGVPAILLVAGEEAASKPTPPGFLGTIKKPALMTIEEDRARIWAQLAYFLKK